MTSLAFILGVMPLVFASGAGREARHSVGTAVAGGMIASTFLNLAFIPVLYVVVKSLGRAESVTRRVGAAAAVRRVRAVAAALACWRRSCRCTRAGAAASRADAGADRARDVRRGDRSARSRRIRRRRSPPPASCAPRRCSRRRARRRGCRSPATSRRRRSTRGVEFEGTTVTPQNQVTASLDCRHAARTRRRAWARRAQAQDSEQVAELSAAETRRQTRSRPPTRT